VVRRNVVILKIDLDEGLPIVITRVHLDVIELVAGEIEFRRDFHAGQISIGRTRPLEEQTVPVFQPGLVQVEAGVLRKMRRADQLAARVVSPAVDRADNRPVQRPRTLQHDRLTVTADVRHLPVAGIRPFIATVEQHLAVILPPQRTKIPGARHHELVTNIARTGIEDELLLQLKNLLVKIPVHRQLGNCGGQLGHSRQVGHSKPPAGVKKG